MPVIAFANPKGGAGKTTAALLLATELATHGATVALIDADPERWISQWARLPGKPEGIRIHADVTEDTIVDVIEDAARDAQFVVVDLEGTASLMVAHAVAMADLVVIPSQGGSMDARGAAKMVRLIRNQERLARRPIAHAVLVTRASAAVTTRALRNVKDQLARAGIAVFQTPIVERAAYRDVFDYGGTIADLPPDQVSNVDKAVANARAYTAEVVEMLRATRAAREAAHQTGTPLDRGAA